MDRKLLKLPFREGRIPAWRCPACNAGILTVIDGSFREEERAHSRKARDHEAWEPEWIQFVYSCMLKCPNSTCEEVVTSGGTGQLDWEGGHDFDGSPEQNWFSIYQPKFFMPHLKLFEIPPDTPDNVASELNESFGLFFQSSSSASNHVRVALENVLNDLKVARYTTNNGRRNFISLHNRIQSLPQKFDEIKELCLAVKWLGNAGSHSNHEVTMDDVLDAYELMQTVLDRLYNSKSKSIEKLAKAVNKKKGPVKRTAKRKHN